jgi:hypothetical protein
VSCALMTVPTRVLFIHLPLFVEYDHRSHSRGVHKFPHSATSLSPHSVAVSEWCGREDLNLHDLAATSS